MVAESLGGRTHNRRSFTNRTVWSLGTPFLDSSEVGSILVHLSVFISVIPDTRPLASFLSLAPEWMGPSFILGWALSCGCLAALRVFTIWLGSLRARSMVALADCVFWVFSAAIFVTAGWRLIGSVSMGLGLWQLVSHIHIDTMASDREVRHVRRST